MLQRLIVRMTVCAITCFMAWPFACLADARELVGRWYQAPEDWVYQGQVDLATCGLESVAKVELTGGHFWQQVDFEIENPWALCA